MQDQDDDAIRWYDGDARYCDNTSLLVHIYRALRTLADRSALADGAAAAASPQSPLPPQQQRRQFVMLVWARTRPYSDAATFRSGGDDAAATPPPPLSWQSRVEITPVTRESNAALLERALRSRLPPKELRDLALRDLVNAVAEAPLEHYDLLAVRVHCAVELRHISAFDAQTLPVLLEVLVQPSTSLEQVCTLHSTSAAHQREDMLATLSKQNRDAAFWTSSLAQQQQPPLLLDADNAVADLIQRLADSRGTLATRLTQAAPLYRSSAAVLLSNRSGGGGGVSVADFVLQASEPPAHVRLHPSLTACVLRCSHSDRAMPARSVARLHELYVYANSDERAADVQTERRAALRALGLTTSAENDTSAASSRRFQGTLLFSQCAARSMGTERAPPIVNSATAPLSVEVTVRLRNVIEFPTVKAAPHQDMLRAAEQTPPRRIDAVDAQRTLSVVTRQSLAAVTEASDASARFRRIRVLLDAADAAAAAAPAMPFLRRRPLIIDARESGADFLAYSNEKTGAASLCNDLADCLVALYSGVLLLHGEPPEFAAAIAQGQNPPPPPPLDIVRNVVSIAQLFAVFSRGGGGGVGSSLEALADEWIHAAVGRLALGILTQGAFTYKSQGGGGGEGKPDKRVADYSGSPFTYRTLAALLAGARLTPRWHEQATTYKPLERYSELLDQRLSAPGCNSHVALQQLMALSLATMRHLLNGFYRYDASAVE